MWGPPLWNIFFADACLAIRRCGFQEIIYADDLNAFRTFLNSISNDFILFQLGVVNISLTSGQLPILSRLITQRIFHVIVKQNHFGKSFRVFGLRVDLHLTMEEAISECAVEGHWRLSSLPRS